MREDDDAAIELAAIALADSSTGGTALVGVFTVEWKWKKRKKERKI